MQNQNAAILERDLEFDQVETAYDLYLTTSDTMEFRYVVLQFDRTMMPYVSNIVAKPPQKEKYKTLKDCIITSFAETTELKLDDCCVASIARMTSLLPFCKK